MERDYRFFRARDIARAEEWFLKYGYFLILLNRFFPGIRSVISISGGISRLRPLRVGLLAMISAGAWNLIWLLLGYSIGANWETVKANLTRIMLHYNTAVLTLLGIAAVGFLVKTAVKRHRKRD